MYIRSKDSANVCYPDLCCNVKLRPGSPLFSLLLLSGIFSLNFFSRIFFAPLLPALEQDLSLSHGQAGLFFFIVSCGYFISLSGSGFVSARIGHKQSIVLSMAGTGLSLIVLSLVTAPPVLRVSFFFLGLSAGIYLPSAITTISTLFEPRQWGRAFGVHELAPNLAFLLAPLYVAALLPHMPWPRTVQILTLFVLLAAGLYGLFGCKLKDKPDPPDLLLCRKLIGHREFWLMIFLFSMGITGTLGIYSILPTFLVSEHGFSEQAANLLVGTSRIPTLATALAGGFLADRFGNRLTITLVLVCTGGATMLLSQGQELLTFYICLQPVIAVCFFPAAFALLSQTGPVETRGVIVSFTVPLSFVIGGGVIPAFITRMADGGRFATAILLTGGLIAAGSLLVRLIREEASQNTEPS